MIARMRTFFRIAACVSVALVPLAASARPLAIQDLLTAVRIMEPQLSPDGRLVAFTKTTTDPATLKRNSDIWIVPADGSPPPRLFIGGDKTENTPRWAADSQHLAFISTRDGDPQ